MYLNMFLGIEGFLAHLQSVPLLKRNMTEQLYRHILLESRSYNDVL